MKSLFEMLQEIFGKNIMSRTIGTRTNVIKLPSNSSNPLIKQFDVSKAAEDPAVLDKIKKVIEDEIPYISKMNDSEKLVYEGNVRRLHDTLMMNKEITPTVTAEVIGIGTKIFLGGGIGYISWEGTQHFPLQKRLPNGTPIGPAATLALIGDAKGEEAKTFYRRYGFRPYLDTPNSLYLPLGG
jgi:hypothetical protein